MRAADGDGAGDGIDEGRTGRDRTGRDRTDQGRASALRGATAAFAHRDFLIFWLGALASNTDGWMQRVAVPAAIFQITGSATWVGVATFAGFIPAMFLGPVGGSLADRHPRRSMLLATQTGMGLAAVLLWLLFRGGEPAIGPVLAAVALSGVLGGLNLPAWQAFVSELVPRDDLMNAVTLNSTQFNAAKAIGPALAGAVLAAGGPAWVFAINALSYAFVLAALTAIRPRPAATTGPRQPLWRELGTTVRYVQHRPGIRICVVLIVTVGLTGGPIVSLLAVFATDVFGVGDVAYGLLGASVGAGAVLAAPLLAGWGGRQPRSRLAAGAALVYGVATAAFALAPGVAIALVALLFVGAAHLAVASTCNTTVQLLVDEQVRGKVMSLYLTGLLGAMPIGSLVQGWLVDLVGPRPTVAGAGLTLVAVTWWLARVRGALVPMDEAQAGPARRPPAATTGAEPAPTQ